MEGALGASVFLEISREREAQVIEFFESFCCGKTRRELSLKKKLS